MTFKFFFSNSQIPVYSVSDMTLLGFGDDNLVFFDYEFSYIHIIASFISVFIGIVMTQSGFDKIFNWEGELDFITEKFAKTPLANFSAFGLIQVTIFEVLSGLASLLGAIRVLFYDDESYGIIGLILAAISLSILMLGQRISKDYEGAAVLVPYFLLTMFGLFIYSS
tara:strand:- start:12974 stop:13474 length:501 start_codon:yes stop_codon:yes gene_type:complete